MGRPHWKACSRTLRPTRFRLRPLRLKGAARSLQGRSRRCCRRSVPRRIACRTTAHALMISFAFAYLSAEDPINENQLTENDRQHHRRAYQHEYVRRRRRRHLPNGQATLMQGLRPLRLALPGSLAPNRGNDRPAPTARRSQCMPGQCLPRQHRCGGRRILAFSVAEA